MGLSSLPTGTPPGKTWAVDMTVLQHGRTPLTGIAPVLTIMNGDGETRSFTGTPTGKPGVYRADVVFPSAGTWSYQVWDDFSQTHTFKPVEIGARADAFPSAPLGLVARARALRCSRRRDDRLPPSPPRADVRHRPEEGRMKKLFTFVATAIAALALSGCRAGRLHGHGRPQPDAEAGTRGREAVDRHDPRPPARPDADGRRQAGGADPQRRRPALPLPGKPTARVGSYRARVVFPRAGRYTLGVYDGFPVADCAQVHTFKPV